MLELFDGIADKLLFSWLSLLRDRLFGVGAVFVFFFFGHTLIFRPFHYFRSIVTTTQSLVRPYLVVVSC